MCREVLRKLTIAYTAGSLGALANSAIVLLALILGLEASFGVTFMAEWSLDWLYPRLVWGGVLGLLFVLPLYRERWVVRGLVWSIVPTIPHFFIVFPGQADTVMATGIITILSTYVFNCVWGLLSSYMVHELAD